jgi:hypothetical protein
VDLSRYVDNLRDQLLVTAAAAGEESRVLAARLTASIESSVRLALLDALSAAADEITRDLAPGTVEVRLRMGEPTFVVSPPPTEALDTMGPGRSQWADADEGGTARLNLRLSEGLKNRIEEAAKAEGLSLNAWLVRAASSFLERDPRPLHRSMTGGEHYTGWVR